MDDALTLDDTLVASGPNSEQLTAVARAVSDILSPAVLSVPSLFLGVLASDVPGTYRYAILYFLMAVPLPIAYVVWLVKSGRVSDFHLPNRSDRHGPFAVSLGCALAAIGLLVYLQAPTIFLAPVITAMVQTLLLFLVTLTWQISIHTATAAGLATFGVLALGSGGAILAPLVPLVAWARLYLRRHTPAQTIVGACLGCLSFSMLFLLRGIVW